MKRFHNLKQKIIFYVMSVAILLAVLITVIMSIGNISSTNATLLDNMQTTARIASQSISSNLHLLTERMYNLSKEPILRDDSSTAEQRQKCLDDTKNEIEFVWLSAYDLSGRKIYGDAHAPEDISSQTYYTYLNQTNNLVIGDPYDSDGILQLCVGIPVSSGEEVTGFLVGSYKYDVLNDVLSMLIVGSTGSACIINEEGLIIGDRNTENIRNKKSIYDIASSKNSQETYDDILEYQTGSDILNINGQRSYIGYAPIPGTNWSLMIHAPQMEFMDTVTKAFLLMLACAVLLLLIVAVIITSVSQKISTSLSFATDRLQKLADGNLTDEVILSKSNDETAILTDALAKTIASLNTYIYNIQTCLNALAGGDYTVEIPDSFNGDFVSIRESLVHIADSLNKTMLRMNQSSDEVNKNSMEVFDFAKQLQDGSMHQAELLDQLDESMALITSSIEKNKENVQQIEQCAENATEKTSLGDSNMRNMLEMMAEISSSVEEISKISKLISDISFQTNLLSLNASIEAARAGEAGKGFAVVAAQIGQLSGKTTESVQQTDDIISRSIEVIQKGLKTADNTAAAFREIQNVTEQYREISEKLAGTVEEQTSAVASVTAQLASVQNIADGNRSLAEETNEMAASSLAQSESLHEYVSKVKLKQTAL